MKIRTVAIAVAAVACLGILSESANAQNGSLQNNLFNQYHTQGPGVTAGMYPAPHWAPAHVGHTYYTYQALMPHEMMYAHRRSYYNFYGGDCDQFYSPKYGHHKNLGALNKTTVIWQSGCNHMGHIAGNLHPFAGLHYKLAAHKYRINGRKGHHSGGCSDGSCYDGCADGSCYGEYESYGGEAYGAPSGCASGSCAVKLSDETLER